MGKTIHNPEAEQTPKSPPVGGLFWNEWRFAGAFLAKKGFAPPQSHSRGSSVAGSLLPLLALWGIAS